MDGLTVLITGASGGIGAATALHLARPSPKYKATAMALHYNSNGDKAESVKQQIHEIDSNIKVVTLEADLGSTSEVEHLHSSAVAQLGRPISFLFANAGTTEDHSGMPSGQLENVSLEVFERTWRVNTLATYQLTQLVVPAMLKAGFGRIIYNSSVAGITGGVVGPHYASSKSGLHGMLHYLATRYAKSGITFNAVAPALIEDTAILPGGSTNEENLKQL